MSTEIEAAGPVPTMPSAPAAFHVMAKPTEPCTCGSGRKWKHCHRGGAERMTLLESVNATDLRS